MVYGTSDVTQGIINSIFGRLFRYSTQTEDCKFFSENVTNPFVSQVELRPNNHRTRPWFRGSRLRGRPTAPD